MTGPAHDAFLTGQCDIVIYHHVNQGPEIDLGLPTQPLPSQRRVTLEAVDLTRTEVPGVHLAVPLPIQIDAGRTLPPRNPGPNGRCQSRSRSLPG